MAMTDVPARRFGIRAKMFIAFGAVAALPCVAAVIGWLSFAAVKEHVADIIETQVPLLNAAHGLETTAARLIAFGPLVNAAETPEALARLRGEVDLQKSALERQIAQVGRNEGSRETAAGMEKSAQSLLTNLNALTGATGHRLELRERRGTRLVELAAIHGRVLVALEPEMKRAKENLNDAIEAMVGVTRQQSAVIGEELTQTVLPLFQLRGAASAITKALLIGAIETDRSKVMSLSTDFDSAVSDLQGALRPLTGSEAAAPVVEAIRKLAAFGDGDASIYMRRVRQLDPSLPPAEAKKLADALAASVEEIVRLDGTANTRMLPLMLNSRTRVAETGSEIEQQVEELATKVVPAALQSYVAYSGLMAKVNLMAGKLAEAGDADTTARLAQARKMLEALAAQIRADIDLLGGHATAIGGLTAQLLETGFGKEGILALRDGELAAYSENTALIERNQSAADSMSAAVDGLVHAAEQASVRGAADTRAALERTNDIQMLLASTGVLLSALIVWFYVGRRIVGRLVSLASAMRLVADGELSVRISQSGNDEIADMADTLDVFVANARSMEEARRHVEEERQKAATMRRTSMLEIADQFERNVLASVETLAQAAKVMAERARSLTDIATSASHQADAAMAVSAEMSAGIQQVAVAASEISNSIGEISQRTGESARIIGETAAGAERVKVTVTDLSRTAGEIGAIVGLIEGIAGQTNLLALNATIEAARAGEAGRGFAVVAGEVKNLASQTANATAEISQQIAATQAASRQTADVVEIMAESVQRIEGNASAIAAAVEEQAAITSGIVDTAHRVASGTQKASEHVSGLSESAATVRAEAGEVLQVAEGLSHEATSLGTAVNLFLQEIRAAR